jgi:hypothetical protein
MKTEVIVGFTGTQLGMSAFQKDSLRATLKRLGATELHHGDCVGADAEADVIGRELGCRIVIHPPTDPRKRAFCARGEDVVWEPRSYMERNQDVVDETSSLVAAPHVDAEEIRSGTWSTVRKAVRAGKQVIVLKRLGGYEVR